MPDQIDLLLAALGRQWQPAATAPPVPSMEDSLYSGTQQPAQELQPLPPEDYIVHPDPNKARTPEQRMEGFRRLLTNFTYSLGSGLSAATVNPRGRALRTQAAMGAALQVPKNLEIAQQAFQEREAQAKLARQKQIADLLQQAQTTNYQNANIEQQKRGHDIEAQRVENDRLDKVADNAREVTKAEAEAKMLVPIGGEHKTKEGTFQLVQPKYNTDPDKIVKFRVGEPLDTGGSQNPLRSDEYVLDDGSHEQLSWDPTKTVEHPGGTYYNNKGEDVTLRVRGQYHPAQPMGAGATATDAEDIAQAIIEGKQPPTLVGLYRDAAPVRAILGRKGYDLATATTDWNATQKYLATLNGAQQTKLRQAITFTAETLPQLEEAYARWKKAAGVSGFKEMNRANLAAMQHLPGEAGSAAANLDALIKDFTSELGTVYKGGNSSTDESLKLAAANLKGEWNNQTFTDAIKRLKESLKIRQNSLNSAPAGNVGTQYAPGGGEVQHRYNPATGLIE